jgi:hypothetical protein
LPKWLREKTAKKQPAVAEGILIARRTNQECPREVRDLQGWRGGELQKTTKMEIGCLEFC